MYKKVPAVVQEMVKTICDRLGEKSPHARFQVYLILLHVGPRETLKLFQETISIYEGPGMLTIDGKRKRTAGGILFYLTKQRYKGLLPSAFYTSPKKKKEGASHAA